MERRLSLTAGSFFNAEAQRRKDRGEAANCPCLSAISATLRLYVSKGSAARNRAIRPHTGNEGFQIRRPIFQIGKCRGKTGRSLFPVEGRRMKPCPTIQTSRPRGPTSFPPSSARNSRREQCTHRILPPRWGGNPVLMRISGGFASLHHRLTALTPPASHHMGHLPESS